MGVMRVWINRVGKPLLAFSLRALASAGPSSNRVHFVYAGQRRRLLPERFSAGVLRSRRQRAGVANTPRRATDRIFDLRVQGFPSA